MRRVVADHIRYIVQHRIHMNDPAWRRRFLNLLELDEDDDVDREKIDSLEQFFSDVACHALGRLITD